MEDWNYQDAGIYDDFQEEVYDDQNFSDDNQTKNPNNENRSSYPQSLN